MQITSFTETQGAWESMLADIRSAQHEILLNQFIFDGPTSPIGRQFTQALEEARARGVRVEVLVDALASYRFYFKRRPKFKTLYHVITPIFPIPHFYSFFRDHRKLLVIDKELIHIGGVVLYESSRNWMDFNARIADTDVAKEARRIFFNRKAYKEPKRLKYFIAQGIRVFRGPYFKIIKTGIETAQTIRLSTPYFSPPWAIQKALKAAIERGANVEIYVPERSDVIFASIVTRYFAFLYARLGAKVYFSSRMNHGKVVQFDNWTTFGSFNLDRYSMLYNYELNLQTSEQNILEQTTSFFDTYKSVSRCIVPTEQQAFLTRCLARFISPFV